MLMYHSVSNIKESNKNTYFNINTSPNLLEMHLNWLYKNGYNTIEIKELGNKTSYLINSKKILLTFDDGYYDFYLNAFPIIQKYGFKAIIFLPTKYIGRNNMSFNNRKMLSWRDIRYLNNNGIEFGSHTMTHPILYKEKYSSIYKELNVSKKIIENEIDKKISAFSYPYAFPQHDSHFISNYKGLLDKIGYKFAVTTKIGIQKYGENLKTVKRLPINNSDNVDLLEAKVSGCYNWVQKLQGMNKKVSMHN